MVLRRLPPTHPQHARCLRAATENVKPGFFSSKSPYGAVQVLDIYKVPGGCGVVAVRAAWDSVDEGEATGERQLVC